MTTYEQQSDGGTAADDGSLTLFAADSLASPSPSPGKGKRKTINGGSGQRSRTSFASYDRGTRSWRTFRVSLDGEWETYSGTWPASGMTRNGIAYRQPPSVPLTYETGSGSLPTPSAVSYGTNQGGGSGRVGPVRPSLETMARHNLWPTPTASDGTGGRVSSDPGGRRPSGKKKYITLGTAVNHWPTPTASLGSHGGRVTPEKGREGGTLIEALSAQMWPTPTASCADMDTMERQRYSREQLARMRDDGEPYVTQASGMLNPGWVEWLMGYPEGWTG